MKELVEFLAKSIVDNKDDVKVTVNESANEVNIDLYVNPDDIGRVIGKAVRLLKQSDLLLELLLKTQEELI